MATRDREQLDEAVTRFLSGGGRIEKLPNGISARPLVHLTLLKFGSMTLDGRHYQPQVRAHHRIKVVE